MVSTSSIIKSLLVNNPITLSDRDECAKGAYNSGYQECPNETMLSFYTDGGFCVPMGVTRVSYIMIGGGGGGGGAAACYGGGGGGAGQIVQGHFLVTGGARVDVHVGKGGYGSRPLVNQDTWGDTTCSFPSPDNTSWISNYRGRNGGYGGQDSVFTVTCQFTGGYTIRARGGCGGSAAYGGSYSSYSGYWEGAHGGSGGHSWLPVYQINYPSNRTEYKLSPCNAYYYNSLFGCGGFKSYTDYGVQDWIKYYGRQPYCTGQLATSSTTYIDLGVFKICPVRQHFRPQGVNKSNVTDRTRSGNFSESWWNQIKGTVSSPYQANPAWYSATFDPWGKVPNGIAPKIFSGICTNYYSPNYQRRTQCKWGGGGASGFNHGGITKTYSASACNVLTRYATNYKNPNANPATCKRICRINTYLGFGTVCRHAFCQKVWCGYNKPPTGFPSTQYGLSFLPGGDGIPKYNTQACANKGFFPTCIKTSKPFRFGCDIWYCLYDPNCCGIRNSGYNGIGYKQCGTKTYNYIYKLNGWGKGGKGGSCNRYHFCTAGFPWVMEAYKGPGSGGDGGYFVQGAYCSTTRKTALGTGHYGYLGQDGAVIFHYQIRLNSSVIREILEGGANICDFPCIPNKPPTLSNTATYTCPNMASGVKITGVGMGTAKSPERVLGLGNTLVAVKTPNPNYRPELGISAKNQEFWYPTYYYQTKCCEPLSMKQFYGQCFIRRHITNPVNTPPPALDPPSPFVFNPVYANITYTYWGGGGGGGGHPLTELNVCSLGGGGGGGGGQIVSGVASLLASKNFSKYQIVIGSGGSYNYFGIGTACAGGSSYIVCYSCGTGGFKGKCTYGYRLTGYAVAVGGSGGTARAGGYSKFSGGCAFYCSKAVNFGGGGGGGGTGSRGVTGGPGGCTLVGGDGGLGTRLSYVNRSNRGAGIRSYVIGGGGGGGGSYTGGTGATRSAGGYGRGAGGLCLTYAQGCGGGYYPNSVINPKNGGTNSGNGGGGTGSSAYLCYVYVYVPPPPPPPKGLFDIFLGGIAFILNLGTGGVLTGVIIGAYLNGLAVQTSGYSYIDPRFKAINTYGGSYGGSGGAMISYSAAAGQLFDVSGCGDTIQTANNYYHVFWGSGYLIGRG